MDIHLEGGMGLQEVHKEGDLMILHLEDEDSWAEVEGDS